MPANRHYAARLARVTEYIHQHLDDELDLLRLAEIACMSPYHWHRIYSAIHGESVAATVKRLRLHRAAGLLVHTQLPVREVARRSGYPNLSAFTRAFGASYGLPPARYRTAGSHQPFQQALAQASVAAHEVIIGRLDPVTTLSARHRGSYMRIGEAFEKLVGWLGAHHQLRPDMRYFGVYEDDPTAIAEDDLHARAALSMPAPLPHASPFEPLTLGAPRCAILRHVGPYADMRHAYLWLFGVWLPQSGEEAADAPVLEEYLNNPRSTPPAELITHIYLPLR
ncbi:AraC family transcriptional regulator [Parachitinimonas caeni]|uniref:AraC family transcriptional regulator n=1 Tax=Parachitinimonas caeni TaxID=3031301 RepID=A0ABT7E2X5_9NEIS|nr:AraC family transcriptional regulator [Parachitinimonas caeni]MDK2126599.1 AraC family transcriptional regulator [Parachitinimonas caeni]